MRQIHHFQLDEGQCTALAPRVRTLLTVVAGKLWLTREGEETDHWLSPGDTFELFPSRKCWLSAETGCLDLQLSSETQSFPGLLGMRFALRRFSLRA